ncbi:PAS domain S-box protein [Magnetospirillum sp. UT-4]|uniref:PAS domain S-box protein n=1 Tax=Magnetospirillum sp. UT-4 TaxID=2681467 RepID=UPI00138241DC
MAAYVPYLVTALTAALIGLAAGHFGGRFDAARRLRLSEERTRAILGAAVDGIITIDAGGAIRMVNPAAERIFGYRADDLIGRNVSLLMPSPDRERHDGYIDNFCRTGDAKVIGIGREVRGLRRDGTVFPLDLAVGEGRVGGERVFCGIVRDITERKRQEDELRHACETARAASAEAERANAAKAKFLAAASHDLRQPVQAIQFFASVLADKLHGQAARSVADGLTRSIDGLTALLDSILDVSRLDAGLVAPKKIDFCVGAVLDRLRTDFAAASRDKGLKLCVVPASAVVRSDPALLSRMLQNLVGNALRYTSRGRILVGCRRQGGALRIEVWDTGIGIAPDRTREIFQDFVQLGNPERDSARGLGLGLAVVDRLARLLGHEVAVASTPGQGSCFTVRVPYVAAGRQAAPEGARRAGAPSGIIVLIDDEPAVLTGLTLVLQGWGYQVVAAGSEAEALAKLTALPGQPSIIVADYRLREGRTGAEAVARIRDLYRTVIPSIIITGDTAPERLREAQASGLAILHKPVQPPVLRAVLQEALAPANQATLH